LVVTFIVFVELFAEQAKRFGVDFTLKCINHAANEPLEDSKGPLRGPTQGFV
jgi:hypothetical protein